MIQRCRYCGQCAGGLVSAARPMLPWPEPDLCPNCVSRKHEPTPEDKELLEFIARNATGDIQ